MKDPGVHNDERGGREREGSERRKRGKSVSEFRFSFNLTRKGGEGRRAKGGEAEISHTRSHTKELVDSIPKRV